MFSCVISGSTAPGVWPRSGISLCCAHPAADITTAVRNAAERLHGAGAPLAERHVACGATSPDIGETAFARPVPALPSLSGAAVLQFRPLWCKPRYAER